MSIGLALASMANANIDRLPETYTRVGPLAQDLNRLWLEPINETINQANNAIAKANSANDTAQDAAKKVNDYDSKITQAVNTANTAKSTAQDTQKTVGTFDARLTSAETHASSANQRAEDASKKSDSAIAAAQEVNKKVDGYDSRINEIKAAASQATSTANDAKDIANNAKDIANKAKDSADKVDQFDQRITEAQNDAQQAQGSVDKVQESVDTLDTSVNTLKTAIGSDEKGQESGVYKDIKTAVEDAADYTDTKVKPVNDKIDNISAFTKEDRVIYAHKDQSLNDLIQVAQSDEIKPKLDKNNPVIIKLMSNTTYDLSNKNVQKIPDGLTFDGDGSAKIQISGGSKENAIVISSVTFQNLIFILTSGKSYYDDYVFNLSNDASKESKSNICLRNVEIVGAKESMGANFIYKNKDSQYNNIIFDHVMVQKPDVNLEKSFKVITPYYEQRTSDAKNQESNTLKINNSHFNLVALNGMINSGLVTHVEITNGIGEYCYAVNGDGVCTIDKRSDYGAEPIKNLYVMNSAQNISVENITEGAEKSSRLVKNRWQ